MYKVNWYPFTQHPFSDSCWSLSVGPDGRIYAAACSEGIPGQTVIAVRYDEYADSLEYLFEMDKAVNDLRDSGRATQCKIHYGFAPSMSNRIMYMATHLSGPPSDLPYYSPWRFWHDPKRCFRGSALVAFDTRSDRILWWDTLFPKEGCRCLLLDEDRQLLYALSYPRDHLFVYNLKQKHVRDLGRIGSINAQVLILDNRHRVWTSSDYGHLVRYDPETDRLDFSPFILPHHPEIQTGWHSVLYDAVASPDGKYIYAVTWCGFPRLIRLELDRPDWPGVEDIGPVTQEYDPTLPDNTFVDHCGGLTFAGDNQLYYVASRWYGAVEDQLPDMDGIVCRIDPQTLHSEEVAVLKRPDGFSAQYVSRGAVDHNGDLFFGHVNETAGASPVGIFKVSLPDDRKRKNAHLPLRKWG